MALRLQALTVDGIDDLTGLAEAASLEAPTKPRSVPNYGAAFDTIDRVNKTLGQPTVKRGAMVTLAQMEQILERRAAARAVKGIDEPEYAEAEPVSPQDTVVLFPDSGHIEDADYEAISGRTIAGTYHEHGEAVDGTSAEPVHTIDVTA